MTFIMNHPNLLKGVGVGLICNENHDIVERTDLKILPNDIDNSQLEIEN